MSPKPEFRAKRQCQGRPNTVSPAQLTPGVRNAWEGERHAPAETIAIDKPTMLRFNELLLARGVYKADMKYYISTVHTDEDIDMAIAVFREAAAVLASEQ